MQSIQPKQSKSIGQLKGDALAFTLANLADQHSAGVLVIVRDPEEATKLEHALEFFLRGISSPVPIFSFPDWETLPYDSFSPHQDIISERLRTLYHIQQLKRGILVAPVQTLMHRLGPKEFVMQNTLFLAKGDKVDLELTRRNLEQSGYRCTSQVMEHGEFAVRGSIIDLFPMGSKTPFRIDLFDDEIDSIRTFDVESQRSLEKIDKIRLLPAREFPLDDDAISRFRTEWRSTFEGDPRKCSVYLDVTEGHASPGLEYYLPLFFEKTSNLFEYLPESTLIVTVEDIERPAAEFYAYVKERHEQYRHDVQKPILDPKQLFLQVNELFAELKKFDYTKLSKQALGSLQSLGPLEEETVAQEPFAALPELTLQSRHEQPLDKLNHFVSNFEGRILFTGESLGRREIFKEMLAKIEIFPKDIDHWEEFLVSKDKFSIAVAGIEEGMIIHANMIDTNRIIPENIKVLADIKLTQPLAIIPESILLGRRVLQPRRRTKQRSIEVDFEIRSLAEINIGAPIVHLDYGIGRYLGLTQLTLANQAGEFVTLEYLGGDKLYVPVSSLHLLSRYSGVDVEHAPLHRLGTNEWQKVKRKVLEQTRDVAAELLDIYAKREAKNGFSFKAPDEQYLKFSAEFPFEETHDQKQAIENVIIDLTSDKPMDRVVCGDVGFGKTEVALRAAFLAVQNNKQVAVLVPTTLLAQQHFQTFTDRFAGFPVNIEVLSRFRTHKEQEKIIEGVKAGSIDILIGTHKILQGQIEFKSLGLLIIDEEHRFGVRQKEAFKAFRSEVDILTLTATPIPRTLNMAMSGIRDLSIIATPPAKRLSIKTFVREKNPALIQEAIVRELYRGGQVYYLHNFVETIDKTASDLQQLLPSARIAVAHGQMRERELEQIMSDFYHRRYNVLVCTTIIETGIDIPTANTIIIDRADKFGLAQLHQLRGRVGRSHHQAYAFCLTPPNMKISKDATLRLEAIESLDELGVGFTLATHDLEIRGAGELLGEEQSGNIQSVGFPLFMELLDLAVKALKEGQDIAKDFLQKKAVEIDLHVPAFIPEDYLNDVHSRLVLYKRISCAVNKNQLDDIASEMIDRFGLLPDQTRHLFKITELRLLAEKLGILKLEAGANGGRIEFDLTPSVNPEKIIQLIQEKPNQYSLEGPQKLKFRLALPEGKARIEWMVALLESLA